MGKNLLRNTNARSVTYLCAAGAGKKTLLLIISALHLLYPGMMKKEHVVWYCVPVHEMCVQGALAEDATKRA